ncbi:phenylalanyl-tRNA synthetase alpha subunit [Entomoplasma freundtii]|uniref:Phenylalanine--tRNA ligase alpha subunit n=1 Tax=Entomoplasma freundtii TaxID=74700 RepID=A0A2K8NUS9_9MOLU|nr:phenylalanine--tRNA ligase subunit alpha [Entomoplasma freundtii]ATZ16521.1 phenylalanyl-tRNA synthetase subunit alpha [Entomoplasma freundtii]TDY56051.1 phenylalanyl-tRNA synthetase alpha subunit [Entomoplasma freundtii]
MKNKIQELALAFEHQSQEIKTLTDLEKVRLHFFGKESPLNIILKQLKTLTPEERQKIGQEANQLRNHMTEVLNKKREELNDQEWKEKLAKDKIDFSFPGFALPLGKLHPLNLVMNEIKTIFRELGFLIVEGTEIETDEFNFQKLNLPLGHPARDMQDTFYLDSETVMRTHATNMTARYLTNVADNSHDNEVPTLAVLSAGNVFRRDDDDATHSHQFMQVDGFAIGPKISFANLKWVLQSLCQRLFDQEVKIRLRPSFFPFTEPSVEVDISCFKCRNENHGCEICKQSGWIEILGAGMINEQVMSLNGLNPKTTTGLAFGVGIERIAMLKFGVNNIRAFYENNLKFLEQFRFYGM